MERVCRFCTTRYAMDQERCPHCGGTKYWNSFEYDEELNMGKVTVHGGLTDQGTGAGFSGDPDDERAAGTRVPERSNDPAQVDGPTDQQLADQEDATDGERELVAEDDGTGQALPPADEHVGEEQTAPGRYEGWSKGDLEGEARGRDPQVSTAGTKAEITERLLADDIRREQELGA